MSRVVPLTLSARIDEDWNAETLETTTTVQILMGDTVVWDYSTTIGYRDDDMVDAALNDLHQHIQPAP